MIYSFDSEIAMRFGINAAIIYNSIRNAFISLGINVYPSYETDFESLCYIHRFMPKKNVAESLLKLEKKGLIELSYDRRNNITEATREAGGITIILPRLYA